MRQLEGDKFVYKGEELKSGMTALPNGLRKRYRKVEPGSYFRISSRAYAWYQAGGKLQP